MNGSGREEIRRKIRFLASGDTALTVELGESVDHALNAAVIDLADRVAEAALPGVTEIVPTFRSLLVHYDPLVTSADCLTGRIGEVLESGTASRRQGRRWRIPACYEGDLAPDLDEVARCTGLSSSEVIARHADTSYHVYMLGFLPGYPYMGDLPDAIRLPRRESPRVRVPAGSVAIATSLTAVYTVEGPAGWHLIGRTPVPLFDLNREPPALLQPGDIVSFAPISRAAYDCLVAEVAAGTFDPTVEAAA